MSLHARGRHRRRSATSAIVGTAGLTAAISAGSIVIGLTGSAGATITDDFAQLRQCESSGNYAANTGNGYYGAYQFDVSTWQGLGYSGLPSAASPATQDQAASKLQSERGWAPWPACSRSLGLGSGPAAVPVSNAGPAPAHPAPASSPSTASSVAPAFPGTLLTTSYVDQYRSDVKTWQAQLAHRGASLAVDGYFGPQTRGVAVAFQQQHGLEVDGVVGPITWAAAWTAPAGG